MKKLLLLLSSAYALVACENVNNVLPEFIQKEDTFEIPYCEGGIVLGQTIEIPYSIENLTKAYNNLPPATRSVIDLSAIKPTHYYVRFTPKSGEDLDTLRNYKPRLILSETPLDREIVVNGAYYHDPSIPADLPTYQYSTISVEKWDKVVKELDVDATVLIEAFIPDYGDDEGDFIATKSSLGMPMGAYEALLKEAYRITGNEYDAIPDTKGSEWHPYGTITAYDDLADKCIPIPYVRVRGTHLLKTHETLTDENGYFRMSSFKNPANLKIIWESDMWDIRHGDFGQATYTGPKKSADDQEWNLGLYLKDQMHYAAIHRAAYRHYYGDNFGLTRPIDSRKEKISYSEDELFNSSGEAVPGYSIRQAGGSIISDIQIAQSVDGERQRAFEVFGATCHELGHVAHYLHNKNQFSDSETRLRESWASFVAYAFTNQEYTEHGGLSNLSTEERNYLNKQLCRDGYTNYLPLFIDLQDDYNQSLEHGQLFYSDDEIKNFPATSIEESAFQSRSFEDVKQYLRQQVESNFILMKTKYHLEESTINRLFELYE